MLAGLKERNFNNLLSPPPPLSLCCGRGLGQALSTWNLPVENGENVTTDLSRRSGARQTKAGAKTTRGLSQHACLLSALLCTHPGLTSALQQTLNCP